MNVPKDLRYSEEHVWVKVEGNNVRMGITDFAQDELGDIVFIELPEVGEDVEAGEPFGTVESVKTVSELYAPINGKVIEVNDRFDDEPELVNESPYEDAWMIVIEASEPSEVDQLKTADQYAAMISKGD